MWEDFEFVVDRTNEDVDAWVVLENPLSDVSARCHPRNTFFVSWEPPEIRSYNRLFLSQFQWVQTCHSVSHPGLVVSQQSQPWHLGVDAEHGFVPVMNYDSLSTMQRPEKTALMSVVISNKAITPAHRQRLLFVKMLKDRLGDRLHVYGRGHQTISDKWEAIGNYRYHLVLENASRPNYITEKLSDALLGFCFPFYYGAPNASEYFPVGSFEPIDIFQPENAIDIILRGIDSDLDRHRQGDVDTARTSVLEQWNLFPMLVRLLREKMVCGPKRKLTIYPKKHRFKIGASKLTRAMRPAA
ncbi:transferase [Rhodopirellula sallentina SM41]|uniref:Transferase n=2 Tax=Rhodopirellula TaxID=265488 RepID=M5UID8_9BACT|nr:transferase [Rhodopirellula sallentina SM41]